MSTVTPLFRIPHEETRATIMAVIEGRLSAAEYLLLDDTVLPQAVHRALWLYKVQDMTAQQVAKAMGVTYVEAIRLLARAVRAVADADERLGF